MYKSISIEQKLAKEELSSRDASGTVRLYREGNFYVAYQGSAVLLRKYIKPDLKLQRVVRKSGFSYLRAGVPVGAACLNGLVSQDAKGHWPASAELSVEAGLGADFFIGEVVADKVIGHSDTTNKAHDTGDLILAEFRRIDPLHLTPLKALSLVNDWRNRLMKGDP